jgi:hypothetical protein
VAEGQAWSSPYRFVNISNKPFGDSLTVNLASSDTTEGTVSTSLLTFDNSNWATPQTVTIKLDKHAPDVSCGSADGAWHDALLMDLLETPRVLDAAVNSLELSLLARHFYLLAQGFNNYYHKYPVIKEGVSESDKKRRLKFVQLFERHFKTGLETILGIPVPERM